MTSPKRMPREMATPKHISLVKILPSISELLKQVKLYRNMLNAKKDVHPD